jgi:RNA 2',3'-cyclic 3'-phosphodiesterase
MRVARSEPEAGERARIPAEPRRRLFFALWPPSAAQLALADATHGVLLACDGRLVPPENFHVTLAFLGAVPERRLAEVIAIAGRVAREIELPALQLAFDGIEYWKKPRVVCATASVPSPGAVALADTLKSRFSAAGFTPDLKPFRTHVTLARKVHPRRPLTTMEPIIWSFTDFVLVDSKTLPEGSVYTVLERFPFGQRS